MFTSVKDRNLYKCSPLQRFLYRGGDAYVRRPGNSDDRTPSSPATRYRKVGGAYGLGNAVDKTGVLIVNQYVADVTTEWSGAWGTKGHSHYTTQAPDY